jgi:hypothetical protein
LPVGSSASSSFGSPARARAIATRCCWPPDSSAGKWRHARGQADAAERRLDAALALGGVEAAVAQRHVHVVEQVQVGDQVEALEDEAELFVAQLAARVVVQALDVHAVEHVLAAAESLQQAGDVEEGGLARARGAGDRDELALLDVDVEATQRVRLDHVGAVDLAQVRHAQHRRFLFGGFEISC